jgi:hypothetical protein
VVDWVLQTPSLDHKIGIQAKPIDRSLRAVPDFLSGDMPTGHADRSHEQSTATQTAKAGAGKGVRCRWAIEAAQHMLLTACFVAAILRWPRSAAVYRCGSTPTKTRPARAASAVQAEDPRSPQQQAEAARASTKGCRHGRTRSNKQRLLQQEAQRAKQQQAARQSPAAQRKPNAAKASQEPKRQVAAKAEAERQKALPPHKIATRKAPLPKASAAQAH